MYHLFPWNKKNYALNKLSVELAEKGKKCFSFYCLFFLLISQGNFYEGERGYCALKIESQFHSLSLYFSFLYLGSRACERDKE
jgi:hypothetical protein